MRNAHIENLGPAIVRQAYREYLRLLRRCKTWKQYKADQSFEKLELECFFLSPWCNALTEGNGKYIMNRAKNETLH